MSEVVFDRTKHRVIATKKFVRSGVVGAKDKPIEGADLGKLSDDDVVALRDLGHVKVEDGRGVVSGDLAPAGPKADATDAKATGTK